MTEAPRRMVLGTSELIEIYARINPDADIELLYDRAKIQVKRGELVLAIATLAAALLQTHSREESYVPVVDLLGRLFARLGRYREAISLGWYHHNAALLRELIEKVPEVDRARTFEMWARRGEGDARTMYRVAAAELERAGLLVRAAISYERAGEPALASALWSRLAELLDAKPSELYAAALARYNLARQCRTLGNERGARDATVQAVNRLEQAADRFESIGQRERAFDCYHVLIAIGEFSGAFEHTLEGSVNAIRILREDNLRHHALRSYERALDAAERAEEYAAAATLAREMTDYARKHGLLPVAAHGTLRQARLWRRAADATLERSGPPELAENALVASLLAHAELGQYRRVGALYETLGTLDLEPTRREHYARAARRYRESKDAALDAAPLEEHLGEHIAPPDVWLVDLIEWEERGSAAEACADVVLDPEEESDPMTRRGALLARLVALAAESAAPEVGQREGQVLCDYLAPLKLYALLAPLEKLYASTDAAVRQAAVRALGRYFYKRTFISLEQALRDPVFSVVKEAVAAIERLRFPHAFDPLARIYRTAELAEARLAALRGIAQIDIEDAADLLLDVLEHGPEQEREVVIQALRVSRCQHFIQTARSVYAQGSARLRQAIDRVLQARQTTL